MLTAIIADDLTGAADTGVQFARAGYRAAVVFRGEPVPDEGLDAVVFDTDSRTRPPGPAARAGRRAPVAARGGRSPAGASTPSSSTPPRARAVPATPPGTSPRPGGRSAAPAS